MSGQHLAKELIAKIGERQRKIEISIHYNLNSGRIIINYPGYDEERDGISQRYLSQADLICEKIGSFIRMNNIPYYGVSYERSLPDDLRAVIEFALYESEGICGAIEPEIYLMGFSAGASAIAAVAHEYEEVKKILLIAPSGDASQEDIIKGLAEFTGEAYVLSAGDDDRIGPETAPMIHSLIEKANKSMLQIIPDCNHQFSGEKNSAIRDKAPFWAFLGEDIFLD